MARKRIWMMLCALFAALLCSVSLVTPARALESTATARITVSNAEGQTETELYRVIEVVWDDATNSPKGYVWADEVAGWVRRHYANYIGTGSDNSVTKEFDHTKISETDRAKFYGELAGANAGGEISGLNVAGTIAGNGSKDGLAMGVYLLIPSKSVDFQYSVAAKPLVPTYNEDSSEWVLNDATVELKKEPLPIEKTHEDDSDTATASIGDTLPFKIVGARPNYPDGAIYKKFCIGDQLSEGLTLDASSIKVYGATSTGSEDLLSSGTDYTLTTTGAVSPDGTNTPLSFLVEFEEDTIDNTKYESFIVRYNATLNERAVVGEAGNPNTVIRYSNDPYKNQWNTQEDLTKDFTFGIDILKINGADSKPLPGAEFSVAPKGGEAIEFIRVDDGEYRKAKEGETGTVTSLTVSSQGKLLVSGLKDGSYVLTETRVPEGFNSIDPIDITITAVKDGNDYTGHVNGETTVGYVSKTVENNKGFTLPSTGGVGTTLFVAVGVTLVGAGAFALYASRKREGDRR